MSLSCSVHSDGQTKERLLASRTRSKLCLRRKPARPKRILGTSSSLVGKKSNVRVTRLSVEILEVLHGILVHGVPRTALEQVDTVWTENWRLVSSPRSRGPLVISSLLAAFLCNWDESEFMSNSSSMLMVAITREQTHPVGKNFLQPQ